MLPLLNVFKYVVNILSYYSLEVHDWINYLILSDTYHMLSSVIA